MERSCFHRGFRARAFMGGGEQRIRFLPNIRLTDIDVVCVFAILHDVDGPMDFTFTKERIAFQLAKRAPALPDWFIEGMMRAYEQIKFHDTEFEFRPMVWLSESEKAMLARDMEWPRTLLPMEELFGAPARERKRSG